MPPPIKILLPGGDVYHYDGKIDHWKRAPIVLGFHVDYPHVIDVLFMPCCLLRMNGQPGFSPCLTAEADAWASTSITGAWIQISNGFVGFADETDAMRFKLRWG